MSLVRSAEFEEEYPLVHPKLTAFITKVNEIRQTASSARDAVAQIRPHFEPLLNDKSWLPDSFQQPRDDAGMGAKTGMWLLYRSGDGGLALSALVLTPGTKTPVHNHLAWGLVGLYKGLQQETTFQRNDDGHQDDFADLEVESTRMLKPGDFYELLPENDIHQVEAVSDDTSVSLHLLGNDNGCIWRNRFEPDEKKALPFKSGWLNVECREYDEDLAGFG